MSREKNGMGDNLYGLYQTKPECAKMIPDVGGSQTRIGMVGHHAGMGQQTISCNHKCTSDESNWCSFCATIFVAII